MAGSQSGAFKAAARRVGLTEAKYRENLARGLKWCYRCKDWHARSFFTIDRHRSDGLSASCAEWRNNAARAKYVKRERPTPGRRFAKSRDGDKKQARARVNYLCTAGLLPNPNTLPCVDCGHLGNDRRHEYDHYLGYASEHQEHVQSACTKCHSRRAVERGEPRHKRDSLGKFTWLKPQA